MRFIAISKSLYDIRKCVSGPSMFLIDALLTHVSVVSGNIFFIIFETPFFWIEISPAIGIVHIVLFAITWICLFLTECRDPGIIPSK